jgi:hypothetical protein
LAKIAAVSSAVVTSSESLGFGAGVSTIASVVPALPNPELGLSTTIVFDGTRGRQA